MLRSIAALVLTAAFLIGLQSSAQADVVCTKTDPKTGLCLVEIDVPGGGGGGGGGGTTPTGPVACTFNGAEIPCTNEQGSWSAANQCYVAVSEFQAPKEDPIWEGNTDGAIYTCFSPAGGLRYIWLGSDPATVDPEQLAQQAVAAMNLKAVPIGIAPKAETGKIGIVGMPVWMWSTSGDPTVTGPVTQTASAGAVTVTATATLVSTVWDMDDGQSVTCWGGKALGTAYTASYGLKDSPTCGYRYSSQGDFTVTATSNWEVQWAGLGQTGTIQISLSSTADIRIGEVQVLVQ